MDSSFAYAQDRPIVVLPASSAVKFRILSAVDRPIDDITVKEICDACGIARSTFYNHFESKYDIYPWYLTTVMQESIDCVGRTLTWERAIDRFLRLLGYEMRFNRCAGVVWESGTELGRHRCSVIAETLEKRTDARVTKERRLAIGLYVDAEANFCAQWFAGKIPLEGAALRELFEDMVPTWLHDLLELASPKAVSVAPRMTDSFGARLGVA